MVENISPKDGDVYTIPSGPWGCLSWQAANNPYIYIYLVGGFNPFEKD